MKRLQSFFPLLACVWLCYGFSLNPNTWLRDLGLVSERTAPRHANIQFWDPSQQEERAIRVFFYTAFADLDNRILDERLHEQMTQYLSVICGDVITLDAFTNSMQKRIVENTILSLMDEWRISGSIDPENLFGPLPFLNVDMVIFMERTAYEPVWRKNDKLLTIGLNLAALELDLGEPIFAERFRTEIPWTELSASHVQAEKKALLQAADAMGSQFTQAANMIKQLRLREMQAEFTRIRTEEREAEARAREEQRQAAAALRNAEQAIRRQQAPQEIIESLQAKVEALAPLSRTRDLPAEQSELRRQLSGDIEQLLEQAEAAPAPRSETPSTPFDGEAPEEREPIPPSLFGEMMREATPSDSGRTSPADAPLPSVDWERAAPLGVELPDDEAPSIFAPSTQSTQSTPSMAGERLRAVPSLDATVDDPYNRRWLLPPEATDE